MIQLAACADCDFLRFPLPPARHAAEKDKSDQLLRAILPDKIGDNFEDVTLLFSDIVSFTKTSQKHSAGEIVEALNDLLSLFDERAKRMGVEKIVESNPDVIMNTLNGDSNIAFFDALLKAGSFDVEAVRIASKGLSFQAPEGVVKLDGGNQHLCKYVRIGRMKGDGAVEEVQSTESPIRPDPYLSTYYWARGL